MSRLNRWGTCALALLAAPLCAGADCPTESEVQAALKKYIETDFWSPSQRETWKITSVDAFQFSGFRTGRMIDKQVEYGASAQPVCPVRMTYSFRVSHADGRVETTEKGTGETFYFYRDGFDEWTFKVGS